MFGLFKKKKEKSPANNLRVSSPITVDMHSHLLPEIDDGSESLEQSLEMIRTFSSMGYQKLITTPHIMADFYKNTPEIIKEKVALVRESIDQQQIPINIQAAAEYYLDEGLMNKLRKETPLLTFGEKYLLFETSYISANPYMNEAIFMMKMQGYQPVLAHPERYIYLHHNFDEVVRIQEMGVFLQMNINSLLNYYAKGARVFAERLIDKKLISFIGSDCHKLQHLEMMQRASTQPYYNRILQMNLLNNTLHTGLS